MKVGIFQDLVEHLKDETQLSKTQLRSALRLYTSSWRYLYGVKEGAKRVDLNGNDCGELEAEHIAHARTQLAEAKARVQAQRAEQRAKKREAEGDKETSKRPAAKSQILVVKHLKMVKNDSLALKSKLIKRLAKRHAKILKS